MRKLIASTAVFFVTLMAAGDAQGCVKRQAAVLKTAASPSGEPWIVTAVKRRNGQRCDEWLFQVKFRLPTVVSWAAAATIPVGGHTARDFTVSALDAGVPDGVERVFSGYVGRETAKVVAVLEDGSRVRIKPKYPPVCLRKRFVWMRGFRYFVHYYAGEKEVAAITTYAGNGRLIYRADADGGTFH